MKIFLFLLSCLVLPTLSISSVLAQDIETSQKIEPTNEVETVQELEIQESETQNEEVTTSNDNWWQAALSSVYFYFCNNGLENTTNSLNAAVELWKPFRVCMMLYNMDKENDAYLDLSFVRWLKNEAWYNVCDLQSLDEFVTSWSFWEVVIPADNYIVKEFEVTFPIGYDWEQPTCIGLINVDKHPNDVWWLKMVERKVYYASFFVWWWDGLKNLLSISDLETKLDENGNLTLSFYVKNDWNMENSYDIQWNIKWLFNFQRDFSAVGGRVIPGHSEYVEIPLWELPSYGWLFKINLKIDGTPYFSYDISNAKIDPAMLEPKTFEFSTKYFKMPWLICGIALFFIILIILLLRRPKQKVVYVQQPQQPVQPQNPNYQQPVQPQQPQNPNYPNQQ